MRNLKLIAQYEGTDFHGFQIQPGVRTVQGVLEAVLRELLSEPIRLTAAGRTDEGVHASGQVVNFETSRNMSCRTLVRALNAKLPNDIAVSKAEEVPLDFHARYSAKSRVYRYDVSRVTSVFSRRYAWQVKYRLNMRDLTEAARLFAGTHDFTSFCVAKSGVDDNTCAVYSSVWRKQEDLLSYEIEANRFLHNMVRIIVGTMIEVGRGKVRVGYLAEILKARDRTEAGPTAPPHGLFLVEVKY